MNSGVHTRLSHPLETLQTLEHGNGSNFICPDFFSFCPFTCCWASTEYRCCPVLGNCCPGGLQCCILPYICNSSNECEGPDPPSPVVCQDGQLCPEHFKCCEGSERNQLSHCCLEGTTCTDDGCN